MLDDFISVESIDVERDLRPEQVVLTLSYHVIPVGENPDGPDARALGYAGQVGALASQAGRQGGRMLDIGSVNEGGELVGAVVGKTAQERTNLLDTVFLSAMSCCRHKDSHKRSRDPGQRTGG